MPLELTPTELALSMLLIVMLVPLVSTVWRESPRPLEQILASLDVTAQEKQNLMVNTPAQQAPTLPCPI